MAHCRLLVIMLALSGCNHGDDAPSESPTGTAEKKSPAATEKKRAVVRLTARALAKIREEQEGKPFLRVAVVSGGSTGFMYDMKFDDQINVASDYLDELEEITVVVDKRSALFLEGATIDWQITADGAEGFYFDNP